MGIYHDSLSVQLSWPLRSHSSDHSLSIPNLSNFFLYALLYYLSLTCYYISVGISSGIFILSFFYNRWGCFGLVCDIFYSHLFLEVFYKVSERYLFWLVVFILVYKLYSVVCWTFHVLCKSFSSRSVHFISIRPPRPPFLGRYIFGMHWFLSNILWIEEFPCSDI